ncbi:aldo/keto reductase [bacterium]|nr:aldo/keto reductase [bacterium]
MNTSLVFGTGGRFGRLSIGEAFELVKFAFDNGICAFDTGVNYCNGRSQPKLFECFNRLAIDRSKYYLCSKVSATLLYLP